MAKEDMPGYESFDATEGKDNAEEETKKFRAYSGFFVVIPEKGEDIIVAPMSEELSDSLELILRKQTAEAKDVYNAVCELKEWLEAKVHGELAGKETLGRLHAQAAAAKNAAGIIDPRGKRIN